MRVNPSHIQAYRSIAAQIRPPAPESQRIERATGKAATRRNALQIEGSEFINYLSKAEKRFLVEKFSGTQKQAGHSGERFCDKTRGVYLDLKA